MTKTSDHGRCGGPQAILRVRRSVDRGSSRPLVVDTAAGPLLVKLRGAGQGVRALVAEVVVGELAAALGLPVLPWRTVVLEPGVPVDASDGELTDLLAASLGVNLAFPWRSGARDATVEDLRRWSPELRGRTLWLDRLVQNPDRTEDNPNVLVDGDACVLIDHGAALGWLHRPPAAVDPRAAGLSAVVSCFAEAAGDPAWPRLDARCAALLTRERLEAAAAAVPAAFLDGAAAVQGRARAAVVEHLERRLRAPRAFALEEPPAARSARRGRPAWARRP